MRRPSRLCVHGLYLCGGGSWGGASWGCYRLSVDHPSDEGIMQKGVLREKKGGESVEEQKGIMSN